MIEQFAKDVDNGLSHPQKTIPSKYFYDKTGDALFVEIMGLPEYYLTRAEMEIFSQQAGNIVKALDQDNSEYFELIELGAGDGTKTKKLLSALLSDNYQFDYMPIDISGSALQSLQRALAYEIPEVSVKPQHGCYFDILETLKDSHHPKVVLFLGSNIGNMHDTQANEFLVHLGQTLNPGDKLLLGADLIKHQDIVLPAYNDSSGVTRRFNLNLLSRINRELGGDFDISQFAHEPSYTQEEGIARSHLRSLTDQTVTLAHTGKRYHFRCGESIHTEISRKYDDQIIRQIFEGSGLQPVTKFCDDRNYFADYIFTRVE